jgi:hypothetical protein
MALDPSIALGVKPLEVANPVNQFAQMTQLQGLQQANQLNELKMQEAQAASEERNALRQLNPANADYENQLFKVNPQLGIQYRKERTAAEAQAATAANQKVTAAAEKQKMLGQAWRDISGRPSDANIIAHLEDIQSSPLFSEQEKASTEKRTQALLAMPLAERKAFLERMGSTGADYTSRSNNAATVAATLRGQNMTDARARETIQIAKDREARMAAGGGELKPLTESQTIKLRENVSKDYKSATTTLAQMDDLLDSIDAVKTAPGLSAATGYTGKYVPSFSEGKAAQAETRLANLRGKVTALGKATASMSGSIGAIANQEWKILADQIAAIDEVKGKGPLLEQIALVEQQAIGARDRVRDIYEKTRAEDFNRFPQFRDLPPNRERAKPATPGAAPVTAPNIDALLDKYK